MKDKDMGWIEFSSLKKSGISGNRCFNFIPPYWYNLVLCG